MAWYKTGRSRSAQDRANEDFGYSSGPRSSHVIACHHIFSHVITMFLADLHNIRAILVKMDENGLCIKLPNAFALLQITCWFACLINDFLSFAGNALMEKAYLRAHL